MKRTIVPPGNAAGAFFQPWAHDKRLSARRQPSIPQLESSEGSTPDKLTLTHSIKTLFAEFVPLTDKSMLKDYLG